MKKNDKKKKKKGQKVLERLKPTDEMLLWEATEIRHQVTMIFVSRKAFIFMK